MDITILPGKLHGSIRVIPSKSQAHRLLICAAFADGPTTLVCPETSRDMEATAGCLTALGANIQRTAEGFYIDPARSIPDKAQLHCRDSGSTVRFLLPVVGALGIDATFYLEGRLSQRPMSPLWEEMERMGCRLSRPSEDQLRCQGKLRAGEYSIDGSVSSQFITGLLLALPLLPEESRIQITGKLESVPYIRMTLQALSLFGVTVDAYTIPAGSQFRSPGRLDVEGDWSNGAFFLTAKALGSPLEILGLSESSFQGDRQVSRLLQALEENITVPAGDIPDLVPILSVAASGMHGAVFTDIRRLRLKESDRVASILAMLEALGGKAEATENTLTVYPASLLGGTVNAHNDHRIAMSAAIAATVCSRRVTVLGAECVEKSYPRFWDEFRRLGGNYEQYIR